MADSKDILVDIFKNHVKGWNIEKFPHISNDEMIKISGNDSFKKYAFILKGTHGEEVLVHFTNVSITDSSDRSKPQIRFISQYTKMAYQYAKLKKIRFFLFSIYSKEDNIFTFFNKVKPAEYIISIETNLDECGVRPDITNLYEVLNSKGNVDFMRIPKELHNSGVEQASFIRISDNGVVNSNELEKYLTYFDNRPYMKSVKEGDNIGYQPSRVPEKGNSDKQKYPRNLLVFGAPGTGKSYKLEQDRVVFEDRYERVTFHPNYSYAQFVGTYKPKPKFRTDGTEYVSYEFVPGPFLRTWINAQNSIKNGTYEDYLIIIEEINRANVAAVFGDVFQLLDRKTDGTSEYEIATSEDMRDYLINECGFTIDEVATIKIPSNMYIWGTMNSADQGVLPIDSAFKRRWNFEYIGINQGSSKIKDTEITLKPYGTIKWDMLRTKINDGLTEAGVNEDKLIGPFFLSDKELKSSSIDEIFKSKLLMYLFEDVLKHRKGKLFKSEFNTFSKIIDAYNKSEEIFDVDVISAAPDDADEESALSSVAENAEKYSTGNGQE
ncbi:AAA family ATPase [Clostridium botulinum]|uniref:AAA family ATPase n=1 Tax=Clostridium botulinum TaxID=1491 RepID=UPI00174A00CA|nr:AAA family ATPase [Clostridium botulinum]MBD5642575.1 AAA family ATPase [Clostridium botulinum]